VARCTVYVSEHAHSATAKAVRIAGLDPGLLRVMPTDDRHAMRVDAFADALAMDRDSGLLPTLVVATAGTTSSLAFDPVADIANVAAPAGCWVHVDAAMAGTAALCPEHRWIHDGVELADSYCFNPHKWMFTNFDCDAFYVADRTALLDALSISPEYLRNPATSSGAVIDYRDWQVPLGRRFRALKLWFVMRYFGREGIAANLREHIRLAQQFARWVDVHPDFERLAPVPFSLVCFRYRPPNAAPEQLDVLNRQLLAAVNAGGEFFLSDTVLHGQVALRVAIGNLRTTADHVAQLWKLLQEKAIALP
jgi:aromatic-L-amino-acid decarboxylase